MRELITQRLDAMRSMADKTALKDALNDIFLELYSVTEQKYSALEQRVRDELPLVYAPFTVYSTVMSRSRIDAGHTYLSPMIPEEAEEAGYSTGEWIKALQERIQPVIGTVFYEADYLKCRRLDIDKKIFEGTLTIKSERYPFKCRLAPTKRYITLAESLYEVFLRNDIPWTTINSAYLNKFFDILLIDLPKAPPTGVVIRPENIQISFAPYSDTIRLGLIPVWNIDKQSVKGEDFPIPALDKVNFEYRFNTEKLGTENGYLVDYNNAYILSVRREGGDIIAVSPQARGLIWNMYRFRRRQDRPVDEYQYPILSNGRADSFSARMTAAYGVAVKTKAELRKLIRSFEAAEYVELESMTFSDKKHSVESYDMNPFIIDELRDPQYQKTLMLGFRAQKRDFFLNRDLISFLVSQVQTAYPEYHCVGTLL